MKDPKRVASGKKSRRKGANSERKIAKQFEEWWGHGSFVRTPSSGGWATKDVREGFRAVGDIMTDATDFSFVIENKAQEGWDLDQLLKNDGCKVYAWWEQTLSETPGGMIPLLVCGRNYVAPIVITDAKYYKGVDFLSLIKDFTRFTFIKPPQHDLVVLSLADFFTIDPNEFRNL